MILKTAELKKKCKALLHNSFPFKYVWKISQSRLEWMLQCWWAFVVSVCYFWLTLAKNVWSQQVSINSTTNNIAQKSMQHLKLIWLTGTETSQGHVHIFATFGHACTIDGFMKHVLTNEYFGFEPFKSEW